MTHTIYYFTSTGNSLKIAKDIAQETKAELKSIAGLRDQKTVAVSGTVGIVFPVYIWGLPLIVADFVRKLVVEKNAYVYGVATYGGMVGGSFIQMQELLQKNGAGLSASFGIQMPGNYAPMYGAMSPKTQTKYFTKAQPKVATICELVQGQKTTPLCKSNWLVVTLLYEGMYKKGIHQFVSADKGFVLTDACDGCSLCAKVCPVDNIVMQNKRPTWQHHCEHCLACLQWCPKEAIQFQKSTQNKKRYHHPAVTSAMMIAQKKS